MRTKIPLELRMRTNPKHAPLAESLGPSTRDLIPDPRPEERYARVATQAHRRAFGQFFTPPNVAALMADWIAGASPDMILDPALGTGILTRAALCRCPKAQIVAFEVDAQILAHSDVGNEAQVKIRKENFLGAPYDEYDAIIMNPPYIRHRELEGHDDARAGISLRAGFVIPKSANLYVYFVVKSCLQLRRGGRGAFLIPSEWLNANFSTSFKRFLLSDGGLSELVLFSGCSTIFQDALTTASVLLVERK